MSYATHVFGLEQKATRRRDPLHAGISPARVARDADAIALLRAPDFPAVLSYLYDWYNEFLLWSAVSRARRGRTGTPGRAMMRTGDPVRRPRASHDRTTRTAPSCREA
jgi:hypothetical protein